jgi:hypothetical protein
MSEMMFVWQNIHELSLIGPSTTQSNTTMCMWVQFEVKTFQFTTTQQIPFPSTLSGLVMLNDDDRVKCEKDENEGKNCVLVFEIKSLIKKTFKIWILCRE